jgi:hypothetical protein
MMQGDVSTEGQLRCIWCGKPDARSLEHILPESLGCPKGFVLATGVCVECNSKFGTLDSALLRPFELLTVQKGIPRKGGRKPTINRYSTIASDYDENGPTFFINRGNRSIEIPTGKRLGATSRKDDIVDFSVMRLPNGQDQISFKQKLLFDRVAVRCLFKIALESIAFYEGLEAAEHPAFDHIRRFVCDDEGSLKALLMEGGSFDAYMGRRHSKAGCHPVVPFTILGVGFVCDFDPNFKNGDTMRAVALLTGESAIVLPS